MESASSSPLNRSTNRSAFRPRGDKYTKRYEGREAQDGSDSLPPTAKAVKEVAKIMGKNR
jgi:hypothetical protein